MWGAVTGYTIPPSGDSTSVAPFLWMAGGCQVAVKKKRPTVGGRARGGVLLRQPFRDNANVVEVSDVTNAVEVLTPNQEHVEVFQHISDVLFSRNWA